VLNVNEAQNSVNKKLHVWYERMSSKRTKQNVKKSMNIVKGNKIYFT